MHRYSVLGILSTAYLLCYVARMAMASAIPFIADDLHLSSMAMGGVLSAFFLGYSVMQIPGGLLADKLGSNRVLTTAVAVWSIITALTAMATSLTTLLVIRVLFGVSEAPFPSAASKALAIWFPQRQIGRANGVMLASCLLGASLAPPFVATLVVRWGWRAVFYSLLVPGFVLALLIKWRVTDSPSPNRRDDPQELPKCAHIKARGSRSPRVMDTLKKPPVLWTFAAAFFSNLASWGLLSWIPTYLLRARGFSIAEMGISASLPSLAGAVGYFMSGQISDRYWGHKRRVPVVVGFTLSAGCTYLAATAATGQGAVGGLVGALFFLSVADAGICTLPLVLVPTEAAGGAFGIVNTAAQLAGFLSMLFVGDLLEATAGNFRLVFYCFVGFLLLAACGASQIRQTAAPRFADTCP